MTDNTKALITVGVVFAVVITFQLFSNFIPSVVENMNADKEALMQNMTVNEKIEKRFQEALDKFLKLNDNEPPKKFNEFVTYKDNKPDKSTISIDEFNDILLEGQPVKGIDSKKIVLKVKIPDKDEEKTVVILLNSTYITVPNL